MLLDPYWGHSALRRTRVSTKFHVLSEIQEVFSQVMREGGSMESLRSWKIVSICPMLGISEGNEFYLKGKTSYLTRVLREASLQPSNGQRQSSEDPSDTPSKRCIYLDPRCSCSKTKWFCLDGPATKSSYGNLMGWLEMQQEIFKAMC